MAGSLLFLQSRGRNGDGEVEMGPVACPWWGEGSVAASKGLLRGESLGLWEELH